MKTVKAEGPVLCGQCRRYVTLPASDDIVYQDNNGMALVCKPGKRIASGKLIRLPDEQV
jgi:hypothetical protein